MIEQARQTLKQVFGYEQFRPGQWQVVEHILQGGDALCVMPTGAGKSLCYQVPALLLPGITLVISPLVSLMKDQVNALTQAGVAAAFLNSSLTAGQYRTALARAAQGAYKIIYVAPERLFVEAFLQAIAPLPISLVAVDEAHCVSQWGQDFRPSYQQIAAFVQQLPARPVVAAFTATATQAVKGDIVEMLQLHEPFAITTGFDRPNLYFGVEQPRDKDAALLTFVQKHAAQSGIVYCATRKAVEEVCALLCANGTAATRYHAGLPDAERLQNQNDFVNDTCPVMVATNAFGMGIDKSNVSFVVHYNMPKNIESYYQEAGRAGRDGTPADCVLLYSPRDVHTCRFLIGNAGASPDLDAALQQQIREKDLERLKYMTFYATTAECLRTFILRYFGEKSQTYCGNCSSCEQGFETVDVTQEARSILACVAGVHQRFGVTMIVDILRGSKNERLLSFGLDGQETYGVLADVPAKRVRQIIDALLRAGALESTQDEYPVLRLAPPARPMLEGEAPVVLQLPLARKVEPAAAKKGKAPKTEDGYVFTETDLALLEALKQLRAELAHAAHVPAYVVFADAALHDMCRRRPRTDAEFLEVSGVGQTKLARYGAQFLAAIAPFAALAQQEESL